MAFVEARGQTDSVVDKLDSTVLSARKRTSALALGRAGVQKVEIGGLASIPSILGNADPVRFLTSLPGVETGSELDAGLHIQGSESAHSIVSMQGVPVYGAKHLLGIFSVFNPPHFSTMRYSQRAVSANRLGGEVDLTLPEDIPEHTRLDLSTGLISAQGTLRQAIGSCTALSLSGRGSFINLLYKDQIKLGEDPLEYGFGDMNLSLVSRPSTQDILVFNLYSGRDKGNYISEDSSLGINAGWGNKLASASWKHSGLLQQIWTSTYDLSVDIDFNSMGASIPSGIESAGYRISLENGNWSAGAETAGYRAQLQYPYLKGITVASAGSAEIQTALESSLWGSYEMQLTPELSASLRLRGSHFLDPERQSHWGLSPSGTLRWNLLSAGKLEFTAGTARQYLFQTGLTNLGMPCEFWFLAGKHADPQSSVYGILSYENTIDRGMYAIKADLYYRTLQGQVEYKGDLFDFMTGTYDLDRELLKGDGRNFGLSVMFHKQSGRLTGWIAYNVGRSLRNFDVPGYEGEYPSNHERLHEFNAVASWNGRGWSAGASVVAASGTPFTAPDSFYLLGNRVISHFGAHNSNRLAPYFRTDLSFNWFIIQDSRQTLGLNFSMYNATMRENPVLYKLYVTEDRKFAYGPFNLGFTILPSVSIFYRL
ncbi:MAG: hypothetical protein II891_06510 [Bacteroidales bacterium]|nr:hypothetical protein [Bacteroidales bacterium]